MVQSRLGPPVKSIELNTTLLNNRSVGNKLAIDFELLKIPHPREKIVHILGSLGVDVIKKNIVSVARSRIGVSAYRRGARRDQWPSLLDCSGLTKWAYGELGVWLPRYSIDQRDYGTRIELKRARAGDLIFCSGYRSYYWDDPKDGVGHVGLLTGKRTVIQAAGSEIGIVETGIESFTRKNSFQGVTRILDDFSKLSTLILPPQLALETITEVRWKILQNIHKS